MVMLIMFIICFVIMLGITSLAVVIMKEWGKVKLIEVVATSFMFTLEIFVVVCIFTIIK